MTKNQEIRETAQNECLRGIANVILSELESYGGPDWALVRELGKQGQRVMRLFGFLEFHGLPSIGMNLDEWIELQKD